MNEKHFANFKDMWYTNTYEQWGEVGKKTKYVQYDRADWSDTHEDLIKRYYDCMINSGGVPYIVPAPSELKIHHSEVRWTRAQARGETKKNYWSGDYTETELTEALLPDVLIIVSDTGELRLQRTDCPGNYVYDDDDVCVIVGILYMCEEDFM